MKCSYCHAELGTRHDSACIHSLGHTRNWPPLVTAGECEPLKHTKPMPEIRPCYYCNQPVGLNHRPKCPHSREGIKTVNLGDALPVEAFEGIELTSLPSRTKVKGVIVEPLDTAELGPIKIATQDDLNAATARVVREALRATDQYHLKLAAALAPDEALLKLRRLLK